MSHTGAEEPPDDVPDAPDASLEDVYRSLFDFLRDISCGKFGVPTHDAEAIVNEIFMGFLIRSRSIHHPKKWLIGAVCHASRAYWRTQTKAGALPSDAHELAAPGSQSLEDRLVKSITLSVALSRLGPKCRETLRMYYRDGYSAAEIAAHLGTTAGYVMQLLHSCRKRVRDMCKATGLEKHE